MSDLDIISARNTEITNNYFRFLDNHIADLVEGRVMEMMALSQIARQICVSHQHLIAVIQQTSGNHPCHFYDAKILEASKKLLLTTSLTIAEIASCLTYDPSNFSKFFKKYVGETPGLFRKNYSYYKKPKSSP